MKTTKTARATETPEFNTLEEERQYWEAQGPLAAGAKGRVNRPRPGQARSSFLAVRLTGEELTRLRDAAAKRGLGPSSFARLVLMAAVEQESRPRASRTLDEVMDALAKNVPRDTKDKIEALLRTFAIGDPPYLLELTDKKKIDEFSHLCVAALLSLAGIEVASPQDIEDKRGRDAAPKP